MFHYLTTLHSKREWSILLVVSGLALIVIPGLNLFLPAGSFWRVPDYLIALFGKFLCYAMAALAIDMIWGYTGILSLGQGVFFALGGYVMGMHLMRVMAGEGVYRSELPDFMVFLDWNKLPWYWQGFNHFGVMLLMLVLIPGLLAFVFGYFAFRSRIKGVYFSIITQALTYALMLLFFRNDTGFGGNNGLTDFKRLLGFSLQNPRVKLGLYVITGLMLLFSYLICRAVTRSKLGRVLTAIRDAEGRVLFSGYNAIHYKLFVWTLAAMLCGLAGALYVPQVGIINPSEMQPSTSIEMVVWVAVGGRGTLVGAIIGALLVNGAKSWLTVQYPELWLYVLGLIFIVTTLFLPKGVIGLLDFRAGRRNLATWRAAWKRT